MSDLHSYPVEDKHKEIVGSNDSQMSRGVEIQSSPTKPSTSYSLFNEITDEVENNQSSFDISDPLGFYMKNPRLSPERYEGNETEASFPQAWSMINFSNFKASLVEVESSELLLVNLVHYFESAFSGVSFAWEDISKDPLSSTLDVPHCISEYAKFVDWIVNDGPTLSQLGNFVVWAFGHILDSLVHYRWKKGHPSTHLSDVSIFSALALALRSQPPLILPMYNRALDEVDLWYQEKGAVTCPVRVWMVHQVSFGNLHVAFFSWVRVLLPRLKEVCPHSREFILQLVEKIFEDPGAKTQLVESPTISNIPLLPCDSFEILLRVTFPATSSATEEDTTRLLKIYTSLKDVALACALIDEHLPRFVFTQSLTLAGEGIDNNTPNPGLAKEAIEIAIWCLENGDCWEEWYDTCNVNLEASVALLKTLTEKLNLLPSSNKEMHEFIQQMFTVSLIVAREGNPFIAKEAAKICIWCLPQLDCWSQLIYENIYTKNREASVDLLKALVDQWPALSLKLASSEKPFIKQIFTFSLGLAGEENNPVVAKEATEIAIWSLTQNVDCWACWENLCCKENPKASVVLLKTLVEKLNVRSLELSKPSTDAMKLIIEKMATSCLDVAGEGVRILHNAVPGNPFSLGKVSTVAIWSLAELVDCCYNNHWCDMNRLYTKILEDSVALLNNMVTKCDDLSLRVWSGTLGVAPEREAVKQVVYQIFTFSLRLAGKENLVLAEEAIEISIWSLTENFDCCTHWDNLYEENIKASVALLKKLVHEWSDHSLELSLSPPSDTLTFCQTIKSFRLKNQKAISKGGANGYLFKEADKYCKVILGRLSRGSCSLKCACTTSVVLVAALVSLYQTVFGLYKW